MKSKPPAAALGGEGNMSTVLEFIHHVLRKKDVKYFGKNFYWP